MALDDPRLLEQADRALAVLPAPRPLPRRLLRSMWRDLNPPLKRQHFRGQVALVGLAVGIIIVVGVIGQLRRGVETTDNAQLEGHVVSITARVSGRAAHVLVNDNQEVKAGDVLVELDRSDLEMRLQAAQADLRSANASKIAAQARLQIIEDKTPGAIATSAESADVEIRHAKARVHAANARLKVAEIELSRAMRLSPATAMSKATSDELQAKYEQARADSIQAKAQLTVALTGGTGQIHEAAGKLLAAQTGPEAAEAAKALVVLAEARVKQAEAAVHQTEMNLSETTVRAPVAGLILRRAVEPGQLVAPEQPLLALASLDELSVVASFKEGQIASIRAGQPARVKIDAFPGRDFVGRVESIADASGARFSLPPDNASGNFIKVIQRIPVRIKLDAPPGLALRPGMSAEVTIATKSELARH